MEDQGFDPADEGDHIALRRCPLLEAAQQHPEVVCAVHRGLVDALLAPGDAADPGGDACSRPADSAGAHPPARYRAELEPFAAPGMCRLRLGPA